MKAERKFCSCGCARPARKAGRYSLECHARKMREWRAHRVFVLKSQMEADLLAMRKQSMEDRIRTLCGI